MRVILPARRSGSTRAGRPLVRAAVVSRRSLRSLLHHHQMLAPPPPLGGKTQNSLPSGSAITSSTGRLVQQQRRPGGLEVGARRRDVPVHAVLDRLGLGHRREVERQRPGRPVTSSSVHQPPPSLSSTGAEAEPVGPPARDPLGVGTVDPDPVQAVRREDVGRRARRRRTPRPRGRPSRSSPARTPRRGAARSRRGPRGRRSRRRARRGGRRCLTALASGTGQIAIPPPSTPGHHDVAGRVGAGVSSSSADHGCPERAQPGSVLDGVHAQLRNGMRRGQRRSRILHGHVVARPASCGRRRIDAFGSVAQRDRQRPRPRAAERLGVRPGDLRRHRWRGTGRARARHAGTPLPTLGEPAPATSRRRPSCSGSRASTTARGVRRSVVLTVIEDLSGAAGRHRTTPGCACTCSATGWSRRTASTSTASSACSPTWCGPAPARAPSTASSSPGCGSRRPHGHVSVYGVDKFPRMTDYVRAVRACASPTPTGSASAPTWPRAPRSCTRASSTTTPARSAVSMVEGRISAGRRGRRRLRHRRRRVDHGHAVRRRQGGDLGRRALPARRQRRASASPWATTASSRPAAT